MVSLRTNSYELFQCDLSFCFFLRQISVVNQLDMQVVVSNVPPTYVEKNKNRLLR